MEKEIINQSVKQLNMTGLDDVKEEYILTTEEENKAIEFAIESAKKHKSWKFEQKGLNKLDIQIRVDKIVWENEINKDEILFRANSNKNYDLWIKNKRDEERKEELFRIEELRKRCDAKYMFNVMSWTSENIYNKKLIVHDDNKLFITTLCFFLSADKRFETELGYSFNKGILIRGISGLGKTHLVQCLKDNELISIKTISILEITDVIKYEGEYNLQVYDNSITYLDDVGTEEPTINHYGTKVSFFKNFIELFYLRTNIYNHLMISTNNSFQEIEDRYGFRVRSRIKDMFNIIDVKGNDMRGR